jgi:hypothetical protein
MSQVHADEDVPLASVGMAGFIRGRETRSRLVDANMKV